MNDSIWMFVDAEWGTNVIFDDGERKEPMISYTGDWDPAWNEYARKHGLKLLKYDLAEEVEF